MSYLNRFSLRIVGGSGESPGGYVEMSHGVKYSLQMRNDNQERCDARVEIDGTHVGTWRVGPGGSINIDRPAHDTGQFTFYQPSSLEGERAALNGASADLGLVKVTFTPERPRPVYKALDPTLSFGGATRSMFYGASAGGTGLSGQSGQRFGRASGIDYDYSRQTVIHLRLVCAGDDGPRPLTSFSTPVPPRVV